MGKAEETAHGGLRLAQMLADHGVPRVFSVPGESFLAALDGFYQIGLPNIVCRHEGAAAMMAEATGKLTGRPGVAFVTRGPGATNASSGVHVARQDSTPMILFVGQIALGHRDREAFQEVDYRAMFAPLAKWVAQIDDPGRLPEYVNRAFHVATSGRPGPVVLALPEDMLSAPCAAPAIPPTAITRQPLDPAAAADIRDFLAAAARPLIVAGGSLWSQRAADDLQRFATAMNVPVALSFRRQDYLDNRAPIYAGHLSVGGSPALTARIGRADRILVLGARLTDIATGGYTWLNPATRIAHIHPDPDLPGTIWPTELAFAATGADAAAALARLDGIVPGDWADWTADARAEHEDWSRPQPTPGAVRLEQIARWLSDTLPEDAIITNGAGNYCLFPHRYHLFRRFGTQIAPTSGSMGYGFPAAIAASLHAPGKTVICYAGDGCFQMTLNEMATAIQFGAKPIVVVANNGKYATIRAHQEARYPARVSGTDMTSPDFAALARAYGGHGEVVERTDDFAAAFARAQVSGTVAVIELKLDPDMLSTTRSISDMRR